MTGISWFIIAGVLLIIEILTGAMAAMCFAVGCLVAIIPACMDASLTIQIVTASVSAVLAFIFLRPVIKKLLYNKKIETENKSNMDAIIGRTGIVTAEITDNYNDKGRVKIDGDNWLAFTDAEFAPIKSGQKVTIISYDSIVLKVKPL